MKCTHIVLSCPFFLFFFSLSVTVLYGHIKTCLFTAAAAKSLQSCPTLCDPLDGSPPGSPVPGILRGKNTGVGCHFLLPCMKVKSESEVAQSSIQQFCHCKYINNETQWFYMTFKLELIVIYMVSLEASLEKHLANKTLYHTMKNK